ncbi:methyltransferase, partial [candidate division KSB1 bacterium]
VRRQSPSVYKDLFIKNKTIQYNLLPLVDNECTVLPKNADGLPKISDFCNVGLLNWDNQTNDLRSNLMIHHNLFDVENLPNPANDWFIATDWPDIPLDDHEIGKEAVFPIHYESIYLLRTLENKEDITRSPEGKDVLDIFCGSGIFGIYAALKGAKKVVCSDINDRALAFTKFNAFLNNVENQIIIKNSDCFKKLGKSKYDLILANPPFEPVEDQYYIHSYGGLFGQVVVIEFLKEVSKYLKKNGRVIAVHFSPGQDKAENGNLPIFAFRDEINTIKERQLKEIKLKVEILDSIPLDIFGARYLALKCKGFLKWQRRNMEKAFGTIYFIWYEGINTNKKSNPIIHDLRIRRKNVKPVQLSYGNWDNPYLWPLPMGLPLDKKIEWYAIYLERSHYYREGRVNLISERLTAKNKIPEYFDFSLLKDPHRLIDPYLRSAIIEVLKEALEIRLLGYIKPHSIRIDFLPKPDKYDDYGLAIECNVEILPDTSDNNAVSDVFNKYTKKLKLPEIKDKIKKTLMYKNRLVLIYDVLDVRTAGCYDYDRDFARLLFIWGDQVYYGIGRPETLKEEIINNLGSKKGIWHTENVAQSYVYQIEFKPADFVKEYFEELFKARDLTEVWYLYQQCFSILRRMLTVFALSAINIKNENETREEVYHVIHDVRNQLDPISGLNQIRN